MAVVYPNNVPEVQERSERSGRAERSERAEQCSEHSWACSGHVAKISMLRLNIGSGKQCGRSARHLYPRSQAQITISMRLRRNVSHQCASALDPVASEPPDLRLHRRSPFLPA